MSFYTICSKQTWQVRHKILVFGSGPNIFVVDMHIVIRASWNCYNVIRRNSVTSMKLADKLRAEQTRIVELMRCTRREIPPACKASRISYDDSLILKLNSNTFLTILQGEPTRIIAILSTLHRRERKFHNFAKFGIEIFGKVVRKYLIVDGPCICLINFNI